MANFRFLNVILHLITRPTKKYNSQKSPSLTHFSQLVFSLKMCWFLPIFVPTDYTGWTITQKLLVWFSISQRQFSSRNIENSVCHKRWNSCYRIEWFTLYMWLCMYSVYFVLIGLMLVLGKENEDWRSHAGDHNSWSHN